ncbi:MAG: TonB-dependent receptor [Bacteroidaceae bacterium]|nr:TonB-dependent receptor [Bacteroidaceae bacterium]
MKQNKKRLSFVLALSMLWIVTFAQKAITGSVKDANGEPLIGVVVSAGGSNGTVTDAGGNYSLKNVSASTILKFSYLGYNTQEHKIGSQSVLNIVMQSSYESLDEVVVVGYGAMKKRDLSGSISQLKAKDITAVPTTNVLESLQGKIAGLDMTPSSGAVGAGFNFNVRGNRSLTASNAPLILVDGIAYGSDITINPNDIESIEVLKDASTTAIYGSRGANGVIMITTKKGKEGKTKVEFNAYAGPVMKTRMPDIMNAQQNVEFRREALRAVNNYTDDSAFLSSEELALLNSGVSVDWLDLVMQNGFTQNYQTSISGGTEKTQASFSLDYQNEKGLLRGDEMDRYGGRLNVVHKMGKDLEVGASMHINYRSQNSSPSGAYHYARTYSPLAKPYNEDGSINRLPLYGSSSTSVNLLVDQDKDNYLNETKAYRVFGTGYLSWNIIDGLNYRTNLGVDLQSTTTGLFQGVNSSYSQSNSGRAYASKTETHNNGYTWENVLTYSNDFGVHHLTAMAGHSMSKSHYESLSANGKGFAFDAVQYHNLTSAQADKNISSSLTESSMLSFFGRVYYKLMDRYMLTLTMRTDGSSVLAEGNKWGYFPSVAAAWRVKDESFLKSVDAVSDLKLRLSYGLSGNSAVSAYQTTGGLSGTYYDFNGTAAYGYRPYNLANKDLKWEKTRVLNFGVDYGMLNNRLYATIDVYKTWTSDLLLPMIIPGHTGFTEVISNVGKTETRGIDVTLSGVIFDKTDFKWNADLTLGHNKEKIVSINSDQDDEANGWFIGQPTKVYYDYEKIGIWQTSEAALAEKYGQQPGDIKVKDQDGDGKITPDKDRVILGQQTPKLTLGFNNKLQYKEWELDVFLYGRFGHMIRNSNKLGFLPSGWQNQAVYDYWTPENPTNDMPRPNFNRDQNMLYFSTLGYEKGDFVKIKDITLAYNVPLKLISKAGLSRLRIYGTMKNFFTFTGVKDYDPEGSGSIYYPITKELIFGVNVAF